MEELCKWSETSLSICPVYESVQAAVVRAEWSASLQAVSSMVNNSLLLKERFGRRAVDCISKFL